MSADTRKHQAIIGSGTPTNNSEYADLIRRVCNWNRQTAPAKRSTITRPMASATEARHPSPRRLLCLLARHRSLPHQPPCEKVWQKEVAALSTDVEPPLSKPPTDLEPQGGPVFFEIGHGSGVATNSLSDILMAHVLNHASILAWLVPKQTGGTIDRIHHRRTLDRNVLGTSLVIHSQHDEVAKPARTMRQRKPNKFCDDIPSNPTSSIVL